MVTKTLSNFAQGEISLDVQGRVDLDSSKELYNSSLSYMRNYIATAQGPFKRRTGSRFLKGVKGFTKGRNVPFIFNDEQAYGLLFSANAIRFTKNNEVITESAKTITGITKAAQAVVTSAAHGYNNGDEIYLDEIIGMAELNGAFYLVSDKDTNSFKIKDLDGNYINSSNYTDYSSGGTAKRIYELQTPYNDANIFQIDYTQNADVMYIAHQGWAPRKLTRISDAEWTYKAFHIASSPFVKSHKAISAVTKASQAVVTITGHGYSDGDRVVFHSIAGMTQLDGREFYVSDKATDTFKIKDVCTNAYVDSTNYGAFTSGESDHLKTDEQPSTVHMEGGRIVYGGTVKDPDKYFMSKAPKDDGALQYDDFSVSSPLVASDAIFGYLPTVKGKVDTIKWISSTKKFLTIGTFATVYKVTGPTESDPVAADDVINVKSISDYGCYNAKPEFLGETMFFLQRNALRIRSLNYSLLQDDYGTEDRNLIANRILNGGAKHITAQSGDTDILWVDRNDGILTGLSFKGPSDIIEGWHRQDTEGEIIDSMALPRGDGYDITYIVVKRKINGVYKHYIEYFTDEVLFLDKEDFVDLDNDGWMDLYDNYKWEVNKDAVFVDCAVTYDGSNQTASLTYVENADETVTVTASSAIFNSDDTGREIWLKYNSEGKGGGRLVIKSVNTAGNIVVCEVRNRYPVPDYSITSSAGEWYLTAGSVSGLEHLEGKEVQIVIDGAFHKTATVENGRVTLDSGTQASKIHVGLKYVSIGKTNNLNMVDLTGNGHTKLKNVQKVHFDVLDSGVFKAGTDLTRLEDVLIGEPRTIGRVALPETNIREVVFDDENARNKHIFIVQDLPYPLVVRGMQIYAEANE